MDTSHLSDVGNRLTEALITDVADILPMVTNREAMATVTIAELDQYMPIDKHPAQKRPNAAKSKNIIGEYYGPLD